MGRVMEVGTVEARVRAAGVETRYRRAGRGRCVLLLTGGGGPPAAGGAVAAEGSDGTPSARVTTEEEALFEALAPHGRVVWPELVAFVWRPDPGIPEHDHVTPERWLRDLLEGLGLDRPDLVLPEGLVPALADFLRLDRDRVGRVVLVGPGTQPAHVIEALAEDH